MQQQTTNTGIDVLGEVNWGSHFSTFYKTADDLLEIMVSYFANGLRNHELCLWIVSEPLSKTEVLLALESRLDELEIYLDKKQLLILRYDEWYLYKGNFDIGIVLQRWDEYYWQARKMGFNGMRVNGIESWVNQDLWGPFMDYEKMLDKFIVKKRIIVHCSFPLLQCDASEFIDVAKAHEKVIAKKEGFWNVLEMQQVRESKSRLIETNQRLENLVRERTKNLEYSVERMEKEIGERNRTEKKLTKIGRDLSLRNADLQQFAYIVSHNLRGPITNITGIALMLDDVEQGDEQVLLQKGLLESIHELDGIIRDLNSVLEVKSRDQARESVYFQDISNTVGQMLEKQFADTKGKLLTDFSQISSMVTIRVFLYSIFLNLVGNSLKYRQSGRSPEIAIKSRIVNNKVQLIFSDNGIGIDLDRHGQKIFRLYQRFTSGVEGRGLGLFMVKTQTEALGGTITVKSKLGEGTRFVLEFPILGEVY
jgi:signal transduction histidine kinase